MPILHFKYHPQYQERAKLTFENYDLIDIISNREEGFASKTLNPKNSGYAYSVVERMDIQNFHLMPLMVSKHISNTSLFSEFECHECNIRFGRMEDHLNKFLGIAKSLAKGKDGIMEGVKVKLLSVHSRTLIGEDILIISPRAATGSVDQ